MNKKFINFLINVAIMYIVLDFFPGFKAPYQAVSNFYAGVIFALMLSLAKSVLSIFGFPKLSPIKLVVGTILTFAGLWMVHNFSANVFSFSENYLGGIDFIFFSLPKMFVIKDANLVILFAAFVANICSIIVFKLKH